MEQSMSLFDELKKRNVIRVAITYAVIAWLLIQVLGLAANSFEAPAWVMKMIIAVIALGFVPVLLFSWAFELTPGGLKREKDLPDNVERNTSTSRKLNYITIAAAVGVVGLFVFQKFSPTDSPTQKLESQSVSQKSQDLLINDDKKDASIAVLPFSDFSRDKDQEYFADGISEELLNVLARIKDIQVSSRTSSFAFKNQDVSVSEIGEALNVSHVLEGSIRKSGNTLRITAQLIDTKTDVHLWSDTYDRPLTADNIFAIQDEIATAIVNELQGHLNFKLTIDSTVRTQSVEAYQLYLRARQQMNQRRPETLSAAADAFKQVIALDPSFAPAYSGLADNYKLMAIYADMDTQESQLLAKPLIEKALELAPTSSEALVSAAIELMDSGNFKQAEKLVDQALLSNPNYVRAHQIKAGIQGVSDVKGAISTIKQALKLDPLSAVLLANLARLQLELGELSEARKTIEDNIRWNPESPFGYELLGQMNLGQAKFAQAHSHLKDAQALNPSNASVNLGLIRLYLLVGLSEKAREIALQPGAKALVHLMLGESDQVRELYDQLDPFAKLEAHYTLNEFDRLVELALPMTPNIIPDGQKLETVAHLYWATRLNYALRVTNRSEASKYKELLDDFFTGKSPNDFEDFNSRFLGAIYHVTQNDSSQAYTWLEYLVEQGFTDSSIEMESAFEALLAKEEMAAILKRGAENAAKAREQIELQLAEPKPNWVE